MDDNPLDLEELADLLSSAGLRALRANGGAEGLRQATREQPNLILLDVMMSDVDGFALCRQLKEQQETRAIPVLFMTALDATADKVKGFQLGAVDYITKPFQHDEVIARVATHLTLQSLTLELQDKEQRLSQMFQTAMDAIVSLDENGTVLMFNAAAEKTFRCKADDVVGQSFHRFLTPNLSRVLSNYLDETTSWSPTENAVWIREGLYAQRADGDEFPIEASMSRGEAAGTRTYTVTLRDIDERRARQKAEAERDQLRGINSYLQEEVRAANHVGEFIGESTALSKVLELVRQVADTDATVLVTGETGTGKELVARAIHALSRYKDKALVKLNCAAIPAGLAESELFGHEKGAFTGALSRRLGRFELADGGTLFLDEIGELSLDLQAKLLRVLQEGEFERVGGTQTLRCRVRLVAATNRDLLQLCSEGKFRTDLYYRLNVFPIALPPLRERTEDIGLMAMQFVKEYSARLGKQISSIDPRMMTALQLYSWPGNVRELRHLIERAAILTKGETLATIEWSNPSDSPAATASETLEQVERAHILKVLSTTSWRIAGPQGAAKILGLPSTTLRSRMEKLGITKSA